MRTERISFRVTSEEKNTIKSLASSHNISVTDFIIASCYIVGNAYEITREQMIPPFNEVDL